MLNAELKSKFSGNRRRVAAFSLRPLAFACHAFTLIELLMVIAILGLLAGLAVPAIKELGKSSAAVGASRQLLDAVGRARQLAIADHTTVYMVFVPTNFWDNPVYNTPVACDNWRNSLSINQLVATTNLCDKQLTGFTFVAYGAVGDQPGQHTWHYLAPWQTLPDGSFIASWKFGPRTTTNYITDQSSRVTYRVPGFDAALIPFPTQDSPRLVLPCLAFNYLGQLTTQATTPVVLTQDEYIPLARGTVLPAMTPAKMLLFLPPSITESPPGNTTNSAFTLVDVDPLTGRATLRYQQVQ